MDSYKKEFMSYQFKMICRGNTAVLSNCNPIPTVSNYCRRHSIIILNTEAGIKTPPMNRGLILLFDIVPKLVALQ